MILLIKLDDKSSSIVIIISCIFLLIPIGIIYGENAEWKTYTDPDEKYSISYPPEWKLVPKENRFDDKNFELSTIDAGASIHILMVSVPYDIGGEDIEDGEEIFMSGLSTSDNFRLVESWECEKYVISGQKTCSIVYTTGFSPKLAKMNLLVDSDKTIYNIIYQTVPRLFDKHLPLVEQIIKSIEFK